MLRIVATVNPMGIILETLLMTIENVIKNEYCLGCGGCQVLNEVKTIEDKFGKYLPNTENFQDLDQDACPISGET